MLKNKLKEKILAGKPAIGTWITVANSLSVEALSEVGFDWLLIDTEHSPIGSESLRDVLIAMKGGNAVPVVRLMNNHPDYFKVALDLGAAGVVVPLVQSAEDARRAVDSCRYPPIGSRGFGPLRASRYFFDMDEYTKTANDEILLAVQIESVQGMNELEAICSVPGIDAIFIGPGDLASSMNLTGQGGHPEVRRAVDQIMVRAKQAGKPFGTLADQPEELLGYVERGATLVTVGADVTFMMNGALDSMKRSRSLVETQDSKKSI